MRIVGCGRTHRGRLRPHNEDSLLVDPRRGLFAVADGMGGHAAGEVASRLAIEATDDVLGQARETGTDLADILKRAVEEANGRIADHTTKNPEFQGMGTTLVAGVAVEDILWIAHVGDSRAYLIRDGALSQLTTDHSFVNELVRLGMLSREEAARDPRRNVVTRALGSGVSVAPDIIPQKIRPDDLLLFCSDGLNTMLTDQAILDVVLANDGDPERCCEALIEEANEAGGEDNITVVFLSVFPARAEDSHHPQTESAESAAEEVTENSELST